MLTKYMWSKMRMYSPKVTFFLVMTYMHAGYLTWFVTRRINILAQQQLKKFQAEKSCLKCTEWIDQWADTFFTTTLNENEVNHFELIK